MELISRQAAIEAIEKKQLPIMRSEFLYDQAKFDGLSVALNIITELPSAQPEIIYCKDCKHFIRDDIEEYTPYGFDNTYLHAFCDKHWDEEQGEYIDVNLDDFCSLAERREQDG